MEVNPLTSQEVCALIVTYNPDLEIATRIEAIIPQVGALLVVDNNSAPETLERLVGLSKRCGFEIVHNPTNAGLATALNQGCRWAQDKRYRSVLTLDDDTDVEGFMVETLLGVYNCLKVREKVAMVGSTYWGKYEQEPVKNVSPNTWCSVKDVITSGTLMPLAVYERVGPFKDYFFIDRVDTEYCLRARSLGFQIVRALRPTMRHYIGKASDHRLPWGHVQTSNHSPLRRYYNTRNLMYLTRQFYRSEFAWVFGSLYSWLKSMVLLCVFERDRLSKLRSIWAGIRDGLRTPLSAL